MSSLKGRKETIVQNRKAKFEYEFIERFEAGLQLTGTEVKSLRHGKASLQEAYCYVENGQAFIRNMNIAEYDKGSWNNHDPMRTRKLLLKKKEIEKMAKNVEQKGNTIVPIRLYFNENTSPS